MTKGELIEAIKELPDDVEVTVVHSDGEVVDIDEVRTYPGDDHPIQLAIDMAEE